MSRLILVLGGARSGKSSFAEEIVTNLGGLEVTYIATSQPRDKEMKERIKQHQASRPQEWTTIEESREVSQILSEIKKGSVVLVDCLTVLISNLLLQNEELNEDEYDFNEQMKEEEIISEIEKIITKIKEKDLTVVLVSNEVGQGLVPPYKLGRVYRDIAGRVNQLVANEADEVYITYAGLPVEIKELAERTKFN
ncbi:adenosyl cobinamide kinase/adenosyl cobinamide phosphate guanylyltransferase [Halobacteroides halobius DSM 5150]|uniref:Adenosylcobinamide kinase n=1 Tax=Halobacteroides halobius (strain ATCC 35273 / DSM 5150 / MD-1) TaxID=748449 RepID=L0KB81_HALHC|nr:bifunctional adenosylcobinamide kinase/adenosylcobinamide-phosphate guanylyltransferase [Halobacteroides halobius]AGB41644.1 adenosyl cobinamide kinase/adenosyl cobinamide phosphate guanylyltransferase [Halobacteroides halobius DSM 5150]